MPGQILTGVSGSESNRFVVEWAAREAERRRAGLWLLHVTRPSSDDLHGAGPDAIGDAVRLLENATLRARQVATHTVVTSDVVTGDPADCLLEHAKDADLAVLGRNEHRGLAGSLRGSIDTLIAGHAPAPVTIVPPQAAERDAGDVVVWLGGIGHGQIEEELAVGFQEASLRHSKLVALHTWWLPLFAPTPGAESLIWNVNGVLRGLERKLTDRLARWQERYPDVPAEARVRNEDPHVALLRASSAAALIVVPSHEDHGRHLRSLGRLTRDTIENAACPVLISRAA